MLVMFIIVDFDLWFVWFFVCVVVGDFQYEFVYCYDLCVIGLNLNCGCVGFSGYGLGCGDVVIGELIGVEYVFV